MRLYGVNYKDQAAAARRFLGRYGNPFVGGRRRRQRPRRHRVGRLRHARDVRRQRQGRDRLQARRPDLGRDAGGRRSFRRSARRRRAEPQDQIAGRRRQQRSRQHAEPQLRGMLGSVKASMPMNRLMVKPMPPSMPTPRICAQVAPSGLGARPLATAIPVAPKMPSGLPMKRPSAMPSGTGSTSFASDRPASDTPALAKANSGRMANATHGCRLSSSCSSSEGSPAPLPSAEWPWRPPPRRASHARPISARTPR